MNDRQRMAKKGLLKAIDVRILRVADYTERIKNANNVFVEYRRMIEEFHETQEYRDWFYNHHTTHW